MIKILRKHINGASLLEGLLSIHGDVRYFYNVEIIAFKLKADITAEP